MNTHSNFFIYDENNFYNNKTVERNNLKSNWKNRKHLQTLHCNLLQNNGAAQTPNSPHIFESLHDNKNPILGHKFSDLKNDFINKEKMQSKLFSPSIKINF